MRNTVPVHMTRLVFGPLARTRTASTTVPNWVCDFVLRDGNGSGKAITRPPIKRLRVKNCICTRTHG
jgi:hypothetical protein